MLETPALAGAPAGRTVKLGANRYPLFLPKLSDSRLHLAMTIFSLQALGQTVLGFDLSIAQILLSLGTCAVLEVGITFWQRRIVMWPASALLTGNGVAFILRVPGTEHGDWWSLRGAPIYVCTAAIALLSKYVIQVGGRHVFNPANFGLVVSFLVLGSQYADPQDLWWGPLSPAIVATLVVIVAGATAITLRHGLMWVAGPFLATFLAGTGALAASGHCITARWNAQPVCGTSFWWVLASSPEILVFSFFMITDPRTIPGGRAGRVAHGVAVGVLASVLVAPQTTEFATKVAILASLVVVCAAVAAARRWAPAILTGRVVRHPAALALGAVVFLGGTVLAGSGARDPEPVAAAAVAPGVALDLRPDIDLPPGTVPRVVIGESAKRTQPPLDRRTADRMGNDLALDLLVEADALASGDLTTLETVVAGDRLARRRAELDAVGGPAPKLAPETIEQHTFDTMTIELLRDAAAPQAPPRLGVVATGTVRRGGGVPEPFRAAFPLVEAGGVFLVTDQLPAPPR